MSAAVALERPSDMITLSLDAIRLVTELQPRFEIDRELLDDYSAAIANGAVFPPVVVFRDGDDYLLADGYHRLHTHRALGLTDIRAIVKIGGFKDALRFSLSANAAHGKRRQPDDYKRSYSIAVSKALVPATDVNGVIELLRCSVRWAQMLTQDAREDAQLKRDAEIAAKAALGKSNVAIGREHNVTEGTVRHVLNSQKTHSAQITSLASDLPYRDQPVIPPTSRKWTESEVERKERAEAGECVVASMRGEIDTALLQWAEANDRHVRIDRRTEWGNPFEIPDDGERSDVVAKFASYYWPHKDGLLRKVGTLRGKVLACWCHPEQCHGHIIAVTANRLSKGETMPEILDSFSCEGCS